MKFAIMQKIRGAPFGLEKAKSDTNEQPLDETEIMEDFDENECNEEEEETIECMTSASTINNNAPPKLECSLETAFVELQHDLREKSAQCSILRETISTISVNMKRQQFRLQDKTVECDEQIRLVAEKTAECEQWKLKYEALHEERDNQAMAETVKTILTVLPVTDSLLGDMSFSTPTTNRPGRQERKHSGNTDADSDSEDEETEEFGEDSISEILYGPAGSNDDELDVVFRSNRIDSLRYKPKKNRHGVVVVNKVKAFKSLSMAWLGEDKSQIDEDEPVLPLNNEEEAITPLATLPAPEITIDKKKFPHFVISEESLDADEIFVNANEEEQVIDVPIFGFSEIFIDDDESISDLSGMEDNFHGRNTKYERVRLRASRMARREPQSKSFTIEKVEC